MQRILVSIPIFFAVTMLVFCLYALSPGDPVVGILGTESMARMTPEQVQLVRHQYGFDQPWYVRYLHWLKAALRGDLGYPLKGRGTVIENLRERVPPTLLLMGMAFFVALLFGLPIGVIMAIKQYSWLDYLLTIVVFANLSVPTFFIGLLFIYVFSLKLNLLPTYGMQTIGADFSVIDRLKHLVMPSSILAVYYAGAWARYIRASMLEVMRFDYVTTARAKGLGENTVILRHIFRNALLPLVTIISASLPQLLGGAIVVEMIFQWPGMGMLAYQATLARDYPILMGVLLVSAAAILVSNFIADVCYAIIDPRIRYDSN
jgi:peptide/nickel transport system permease protein